MASADAWFWPGPDAADRAIEELARHDLVAEDAGSRPDLTVIHVRRAQGRTA
jgi:hypothetical protein